MDLQPFGFTATQERVYLALLRLSPATGYAVAHATKLARANAYDALEGLAARGAVTRLSGKPARYAAVEPGALVARLREQMSAHLEALTRELSRVPRTPEAAPFSIEPLPDRAALLVSATACARGAGTELLAVVGPWVPEIFDDLEARARGPGARLLSLGAPGPRGATVREVPVRDIAGYWGGLPIAIVADRRRAVCGIVQPDRSATGVATEHPALIPFLRHLLRRELASAAPQRLS